MRIELGHVANEQLDDVHIGQERVVRPMDGVAGAGQNNAANVKTI